jgi:NAD(P)H-hydrate epimerase
MRKVLTAEQMREVDRLTTEEYGIPSLLLMENAAHAVARVITEKLGVVDGKLFRIFCGKGNNGGDGAALARILWLRGARCLVYLFGKVEDTHGDARTNFEIARNLSAVQTGYINANTAYFSFDEIIDVPEYLDKFEYLEEDVCIDALFGTGLTRPMTEDFRNLFRGPVFRGCLIVSLDLPSGAMADSSELFLDSVNEDIVIKADLTVTFTSLKLANVLPPASRYNGELHVVQIGSPNRLLDEVQSNILVSEQNDPQCWLRMTRFRDGSYKNKRGHALMIAGSKNYSGAAVLCGDAAIRSGVGLVTLAVPESSRESVVARVSPEVMVRGLSETDEGSAALGAVDEINGFLKNVDVVAIGSGLSSKEDETREFIRQIVEDRRTPVVIDADGLTALSPFDIEGSTELPLILTPHEGEFMRLLGTDDKDVIKDRVAAVRDFAVKHKVILVLKGERGLIGGPDGRVVVNPTGNSGLGKAGNGDTLTGIITGFIGQAIQMKIDIFETVVAAVYVAGMAGDVAERKFGKRVMTASDVRECLVDVFEELTG